MIKFEDIAKRVSILDAAEFCGLTVKQYRSPCPACNQGGERALQFFTDTQRFKCWAATEKTWGDSVQLVSHVQGITLAAAARELAKHFGLEKPGEAPKEKTKGFDRAKYQEGLHREHDLLTEQGITPEMARKYDIGVAPKGTHVGRIVFPIYEDGQFVCYVSVTGLKFPKLSPRTSG